MTDNSSLLYPEATARLHQDLTVATHNWDYLSGVSGKGPIEEFEEAFGQVAGGKYVIAVPNATSALFIALVISGIGRGDEVILPSYTWPQTLTPVILTGATPVFADIDSDTVTISPESVERLITTKTRAIIGVHLYGIPADVKTLGAIARKNNCILIYDAAQGFGAEFNIRPVGAYGDFVAFSFGRSKLFSVGEGGALICRTRKPYEKAIAFSQHPLRMHREIDDAEMRQSIDGVSMNFRIHPLIASLALGQLQGLINSGKLEKLKAQFIETYQKLHRTEMRQLLPTIVNGASPSGILLPVLFNTDTEILQYSHIIEATGLKLHRGGIQKPLHLTASIQNHRPLFNRNKGFRIPSHKSHKYKSCPNTERRCNSDQSFLK